MKCTLAIYAFGLAAGMGGCLALPVIAQSSSSAMTSATNSKPVGSMTVRSLDPVAATINGKLKKNLSYAETRSLLLANGWKPVVTKQCMANVIGGNYKHVCSRHPDDRQCHVCDELPELNACSGSGECVMQFNHAGSRWILRSGTYGEIGDTNSLMVTGWGFQTDALQ